MGAFIQFGCSHDIPDMTGKDLRMARKYNAEWVGSTFQYNARMENGELVQKGPRKFIVTIQNSDDITRILEDTDYRGKRGQEIADFVHDSLVFQDGPERPETLNIEFVKYSKTLGAEITRSFDFTYELDSLQYKPVE